MKQLPPKPPPNAQPWNPPQPQTAQLTFDQLLGIYKFFNELKEPSPAIKTCMTALESHIVAFINSLKTNGPTS